MNSINFTTPKREACQLDAKNNQIIDESAMEKPTFERNNFCNRILSEVTETRKSSIKHTSLAYSVGDK